MKFKIKGSIIIPKKDVPEFFINTFKDLLTFSNPFDPKKDLKGYRETAEKLYVPKSFDKKIKEYIKDTEFERIMVDAPTTFELKPDFKLYPYQEVAKEELLKYFQTEHSVLFTAQTGAGKSYSITSVIQQLGQRTLILAHLSLLTHQLKHEMETNSTAKVVELNSRTTEEEIKEADILVGTFALLHQNIDLVWALAANVGTLIVDETENMLSDTRLNVIFRIKPKYSIFISATPTRELLQQTPLLRYFISNNIVEMTVPEEFIIQPQVLMLNYTYLHWTSPNNPNWYKTSLWAFLRDSGIADDTCELIQLYHQIYKGCQWVIVDLTRAQDYIKNTLIEFGMPKETIAIIRGATSKKERKAILDGIDDGSIRVLLGSAPLSAGVSIPHLNIAYRLMPHSSSDELMVQQIGRLKRFAKFKTEFPPLFFDYAIEGSLAYKGKQRFKWYKQHFNTEFVPIDDILL